MPDALRILDEGVFQFLNGGLANPFFDFFFTTITDFGLWQIPIALAALGLLVFGDGRLRTTVVLAVLSVLLADMIGQDMKDFFGRLRPYLALGEEAVRLPDGGASSRSPSFPSNHAVNVFAAWTAFGYYLWPGRRLLWFSLLPLPVLVAFSRIYVGVHFPADVVAGALLGCAVSGGLLLLQRYQPAMSFDSGTARVNWPGVAALLLVALYLYRYSIASRAVLPLVAEEAQYWDWSRHLDWSYYSKPPFIAYLIRVFTAVFGNNEFGVRSAAVTLALGMTVVLWVTVREMFGSNRLAALCALVLNVVPLFAVGSLILTTDTPLLFFWGLCLYALHRALLRGQTGWWYAAGVFFGFGLLSKYAMIYVVPCLAVFLLLMPDQRRWLRRPEPYAFLLIGALVFLPVILWSWANDWVNFRHVAGLAKVDEGFRIDFASFGEYVGSQAALASPVLFVFMVWGTWRLFRSGEWRDRPELTFLASFGAPVFLMLLVKSLQGDVLGNWAAPAYYAWGIFGVYTFDEMFRRRLGTRALRGWIVLAVVGFIIPLFAMFVLYDRTIARGMVHGLGALGIPVRANLDPGYQAVGHDELGEWVSDALAEMGAERTFIVTKRYQEAAVLAFYVEGQPRTWMVNFGDRRMTQYQLWGVPGEEFAGWNGIYVTKGSADSLKEQIAGQAEEWSGPEYLVIEEDGLEYRDYTLFRFYGFSGEFPDAVLKPGDF